jgi:RNA recognition motif-containing protein
MRGFGFVTLGSAEAAQAALGILQTAEVRGRRLMINIAHPRGDRPSGFAGADRSRPPPRMDGSRVSEPRYPTEPPMSFEGGGGGGAGEAERRGRSAAPPEGEFSEEARKKKKKVKGGPAGKERPGEERKRGGGSSWRSLADKDDED